MKFIECPTCAAKPGSPTLCPSCIQNRETIEKLTKLLMVNQPRIIKAKNMKPGMIINTKADNSDPYGICLVLACTGFKTIEYTHLNYQDSYGGAMVGSIKGKDKIAVFEGNVRLDILKTIKNEVFRNLHDIENLIDMIRLIEAMQ